MLHFNLSDLCVCPESIFQLFANSIKLCLDKFLLFDKLCYTCAENYIPSILFIHMIYLQNGNSSIFQKDWDIVSPGGILGSEIFPSLYLKKNVSFLKCSTFNYFEYDMVSHIFIPGHYNFIKFEYTFTQW